MAATYQRHQWKEMLFSQSDPFLTNLYAFDKPFAGKPRAGPDNCSLKDVC
ncbi:MAG TPA: hypothetical protein PK156_32805 [Polyangium sp.]|nr:hypothetical protein [Polyangium sp.]